ncbi:choloylglycine hydrolase [Bosea sp. Root381]|uniref:linear amide C-N hydrolase n=1 Tax=Bosea sp. Root381 TaxID=1736524 RepID=UPI00070077DC|nr:choloylglycine hydrolase family protein [Bosea sp. Root381]KRE16807.1 choloylglycine hydrolase [Bosea sp. Root381]
MNNSKRISNKSLQRTIRNIIASTVASVTIASQSAQACTSFLIRTTDNSAVYARTMEFGFDMESSALVIPRNYKLTATGTGGKPGMSWTGQYAAVGMNAMGAAALVDGMNEKGLVGGILYFPGFAGYADPAKSDPAKSLAPWEVLTWALTSFATVAEVKAALTDISVVNVVEEKMGIVPPVHYTLHDATGDSLVIEPVDGKLKVYDNPLGVMTNSPSFDWHMTNLRNYLKLSPVNATPLKIGSETFAPLGQGSGMLGIPGDPTPPSRFLRALGYTLSIEKKPSGPESVRLAEHIINNFDIPKGWVRDKNQGSEPLEYTQWSTVADIASKVYYVKSYSDPVLRGIDLKSFDLDANGLVSAPLTPAMTPPALAFPKP